MHDELIRDDAMASLDEFSKDAKTISTDSSLDLKCSDLLQKRYILVLLCIFGIFNIYSTRVSLNIGLVCMVNHTAVLNRSQPRSFENITQAIYHRHQSQISMNNLKTSEQNAYPSEDGPFVWDEELQGIILGSFFGGYITTQLAGGFLADRYGGKWVWGFSLLISSLLTMLVPIAAYLSTALLVATRILCGAAQGFTFPVLVSILSKWSPVQERARLFSLSILGIPLGIVTTYSFAPILCTSPMLAGWPAIFYISGFLGIVWFALWAKCMYDYPSDHPWITDKEKLYIENGYTFSDKKYVLRVPWARLLTSPPLWALAICEFCHTYKFLMIITELPTFLKVVLNFNLHEIGIYSSVPQFATPLCAVLVSWIADVLISKQKMSVGTLRKSATLIAFCTSAICLLGVVLLTTQRTLIVALIWITSIDDSLILAGFAMTPYDMSPNFAGTIKGIVHTFGAIGGIISPYVIGILTKNNNTKAAWDTAFYIVIVLYVFGGMTFLIFGSGEIQPWNSAEKTLNDESVNSDEERLLKKPSNSSN